ncbi:protein downstream neighbor of Son-like [Ornithodoros turicata]|uniref:protein downstream neighbor of Son-like n=1 Tax=Ornithodoros turicata TaxID=34597 RepID=UPI003139AB6E
MDSGIASREGQNENIEGNKVSSHHWIKPNEVLRLRRVGKRRLQPRALQPVDINAAVAVNTLRTSESNVINPFRCRAQKRLLPDDSDQFLGRTYKPDAKQQKLVISRVAVDTYDDETQHSDTTLSQSSTAQEGHHPQLPLDWTLKTRVRFFSAKPFPWNGSLKTCEEASGTTGFVRAIDTDSATSEACTLDSSPQARFHQQCLYWMHPHLPWLRLFPRQGAQTPLASPQLPTFVDGPAQISLRNDWSHSFRSLYQLLRARQCPFFYLCAPQFTTLFRAAGVGGIADLHALLTPTTRGLRQSLQEEGIQYRMPLCDSQEDSDETLDGQQHAPTDAERKLECTPEDEPVSWLESLGLSQADFPSLSTKQSRMEQESKEDRRPRSLVYVERENAQALFNFLLNSRSCIAPTGPLAGIPPTLLAPVAFHGASLRSLKVRQGLVKQGTNNLHAIELNGPMLPSHMHGLCTLFSSTQEGGAFTVNTTPHQPTAAFNAFHPPRNYSPPTVFATEALKDCGLPKQMVQQLCAKPSGPQPTLTHIKAENGSYDLPLV